VTGWLWDTENGDKDFDEINLVSPAFNSGWKKVMGPISESQIKQNDLALVTFVLYRRLIENDMSVSILASVRIAELISF
jgi:hypothetical protein